MAHTLMNIIYPTGPSRCSTSVCSCPGDMVVRLSLSRLPCYLRFRMWRVTMTHSMRIKSCNTSALFIEHDGYLARVLTVD